MNWYLANMIFQVRSSEHTLAPHFDEQWRLIRADEMSWAFEKATGLGRLEETNYLNDRDETEIWKFIEVTDIHLIRSWQDGDRLISATQEPKDAIAYIEALKMKSKKAFALARNFESNSKIQIR